MRVSVGVWAKQGQSERELLRPMCIRFVILSRETISLHRQKVGKECKQAQKAHDELLEHMKTLGLILSFQYQICESRP